VKPSSALTADIDATAAAIKDARLAGAALGRAGQDIAAALDTLEMNLRVISIKGWFNSDLQVRSELQKLSDRIERLRELRNMAEFGAFDIQVGRVMDEAWRKLP
jgi:hypothetical protein